MKTLTTAAVEPEEDEYWVSISDLMSGLMMIFLFIAVSYMIQAHFETQKERIAKEEALVAQQEAEVLKQDAVDAKEEAEVAKQQIKMIASNYSRLQDELYNALFEEFREDLPKWSALIDRETLSITFQEPEILFQQGQADLKENFRTILLDFFPRYVNILIDPKFKSDIEEIRIEGHTSSEWAQGSTPLEGYFRNMELSQDRTRSVLEYTLQLSEIDVNRQWVRERLTANGLSSSKPILTDIGIEDENLSRRVEFRVRTNAEKRIKTILTEGNGHETP